MTEAMVAGRSAAVADGPLQPRGLVSGRTPYVVSGGLALTAAIGAGVSLVVPDLLGGVAVGKGNLRGTALVVLVIAVPLLLAAMRWTAHGSARGLVVWLGVTMYLIYQAVMFCFATPINSLFFAYVGHLGFGIWTLVWVLVRVDLRDFAARLGSQLPARRLAAVSMGLVTAFAVIWLARSLPAVFGGDPTSAVDHTGLLTNPLWVQDLAFWFPAGYLAGIWMWRGRGLGTLLTGAVLTYDVIEALSIASDQWWGSRADDRYPDIASMSAVPAFLVLAALTALPLAWYLHYVRPRRSSSQPARTNTLERTGPWAQSLRRL